MIGNVYLCKGEVEEEKHLITKCPLCSQGRGLPFQACRQNSIHVDALSVDHKFIFILANESKESLTLLR